MYRSPEQLRQEIARLQVEADRHGTARQQHDSEVRKIRREIAVLNEDLVQALTFAVNQQAAAVVVQPGSTVSPPAAPPVSQEPAGATQPAPARRRATRR